MFMLMCQCFNSGRVKISTNVVVETYEDLLKLCKQDKRFSFYPRAYELVKIENQSMKWKCINRRVKRDLKSK